MSDRAPGMPLDDMRGRLERLSDPLTLLERIFSSAPVGLQIYEASGHCLPGNQAFRDLFGPEPPPASHVLQDEFVAAVSRELRTPLQAILAWARLLQEIDPDPARLSQGLATIERNAKVQAQLVDDILDASRLVTGKLRVDWQSVDLAEV